MRYEQEIRYYVTVKAMAGFLLKDTTAFSLFLKGKGSETVKPNQKLSISKTELFGANFMQIGL